MLCNIAVPGNGMKYFTRILKFVDWFSHEIRENVFPTNENIFITF